jgi:hypothetical protein
MVEMTIKQIFDEIANESSTNEKMNILAKYSDNKLLEKVLYLTHSPRVKFYIKQIPEYTRDPYCMDEGNLTHLKLHDLMSLCDGKIRGSAASNLLHSILSVLSPDNAYIVERIIEKKSRIGMGTSNINKVFPKLIEKVGYLGAKSYSNKLVKNIFKSNPINFSKKKWMEGTLMLLLIVVV